MLACCTNLRFESSRNQLGGTSRYFSAAFALMLDSPIMHFLMSIVIVLRHFALVVVDERTLILAWSTGSNLEGQHPATDASQRLKARKLLERVRQLVEEEGAHLA
jgi:hypothetical protein